MLVEKEVIAPGKYWYIDEKTGLPRTWEVTPDTVKQLHDDGNKMLSSGLSVPVPFEHDFQAHPMTPKEKLLNNAGEVKEYQLKDGRLVSLVDVRDEDAAKKISNGSIRWTSPWITSFTDGNGQQWNNVIAHLALTTRPRVTKQAPFKSIAAALSLASPADKEKEQAGESGICLSRAGRLVVRKKTGKLQPQYPMAFSMYSGVKLAEEMEEEMEEVKDDGEEVEKKKKKKGPPSTDGKGSETGEDESDEVDVSGMMNPLNDRRGDVKMEELLCDLLAALGIMMPENCGEGEFKRHLYEAAMGKIRELTSKAQMSGDQNAANAAANTTSPAGNANPLIQQEQQPMYMSLEEINALSDPIIKKVALSMYEQNQKLQAALDAGNKRIDSLNASKLKEATNKRAEKVKLLGKVSPNAKAGLEAMLTQPAMALSIGADGEIVDPMAPTLAVLEAGLVDVPRLLTTDTTALSMQPQPTDADALTPERVEELADGLARRMGCPPVGQAS